MVGRISRIGSQGSCRPCCKFGVSTTRGNLGDWCTFAEKSSPIFMKTTFSIRIAGCVLERATVCDSNLIELQSCSFSKLQIAPRYCILVSSPSIFVHRNSGFVRDRRELRNVRSTRVSLECPWIALKYKKCWEELGFKQYWNLFRQESYPSFNGPLRSTIETFPWTFLPGRQILQLHHLLDELYHHVATIWSWILTLQNDLDRIFLDQYLSIFVHEKE